MSVEELRSRIDNIDQEMVRLLNERAGLAVEIGRLKERDGRAVFSPEREAEIFRRLKALNQGPLPDACLEAVYREVLSGCRSLARVLKVCYLGPPGTFSHLAARQRFGAAAEYIHVRDIAAVFDEVRRAHADYGVVPVENSTIGSVAETLDMFVASDLKVAAEVMLPIHHNLLGKGPREGIRRIYSKPEVFSQCREWLAHNMPDAELREEASTARAAALAAQEPGAAAIGTTLASHLYDLDVVVPNIEDHAGNMTRFFVLSRTDAPPGPFSKTSLLVAIEDRVGALYDLLEPFRTAGINLTKIESHPSREQAWHYWFFVDLAGHEKDEPVARALEEVRRRSRQVKVLGSYPAAEPVAAPERADDQP